jgi:large subunit ribosomal protein L15
MKLNQLSDNSAARQDRKRIGRGIGSGTGKTSGRGHKGQNSRSGVSLKGFEGGQMPLNRRLPKRGFKNIFRKDFAIVNLDRLQAAIDAGKLDPKKPVDAAALQSAGVVKKTHDGVRLLAKGALKTKVDITVAGASKAARAAVEEAGGSLTLIAVKPAPTAATPRKSAAPAATGA